jgi:hypothetical protein
MNKSFAIVLGVVGAVSAMAGASPAMAHFKSTVVVGPGSTASGTVVATNGASVTYSLPLGVNATSATLTLTPFGVTFQQSLVAIDCTSGSATSYSVGTSNTVACPPLSTKANSAQALISLN